MKVTTKSRNVIYLEWNNKEHLKAVSKLHIALLPESILSKLGFLFLSKFYYAQLTKNNLIDVYLYRQEGEYVGFISCTNAPFTFMKEGVQKSYFLLSFVMGLSLLLNPCRILLLLKFVLQMRKDTLMEKLQSEHGTEMGEFLSFGVLEKYRKTVDKDENTFIPHVLIQLVLTHFGLNNIKYILLRIIPTNLRAIKFYQKNGGIITPSDNPNEVVVIMQPKSIL